MEWVIIIILLYKLQKKKKKSLNEINPYGEKLEITTTNKLKKYLSEIII